MTKAHEFLFSRLFFKKFRPSGEKTWLKLGRYGRFGQKFLLFSKNYDFVINIYLLRNAYSNRKTKCVCSSY